MFKRLTSYFVQTISPLTSLSERVKDLVNYYFI